MTETQALALSVNMKARRMAQWSQDGRQKNELQLLNRAFSTYIFNICAKFYIFGVQVDSQ